ncbi:hypothetical protein, partial [Endozoicomonas sp. YOMI1]|uniref:hypothetical protein n=1 Tax=Endozoicomonas sp. YOMI1 TaxID=2828739 RepID=UPI0021476812
ASLKKTCRLYGLSFWDYLKDRLNGVEQFPRLESLVEKASQVLSCGLCSSFREITAGAYCKSNLQYVT